MAGWNVDLSASTGTGIIVGADPAPDGSFRDALFARRLSPMARLAKVVKVEEFADVLRTDRKTHLHRAEEEASTILETSFLRDYATFEMLRETVLPALIASRRKERRLQIWSAGCSTGQETYSLAMLLCGSFPELAEWDIRIVGTDVSRHALAIAKLGRYRRLEVNRGLPVRMLMTYMVDSGGVWEISHKVRRLCEFAEVDLCAKLPEMPVFDLILLRNVLLYLPRSERGGVFQRLRAQAKADGYLVLGKAEQAEDSTKLFDVEAASDGYVYRPVKAV
jgi:chemotaxis protein methyltransferase CheR